MGLIGRIIYSTISSPSKVEHFQQLIRDTEWKSFENYIPSNSSFLDVGCGAGYAMFRASNDKNCNVFGVDPEPGAHGVGRFLKNMVSKNVIIQKGVAESLTFDNDQLDVVFSSHVLEHVEDEQKALQEMSRVLNPNGILIIGMPTATMAWLNLISNFVFTTHIKLYNIVRHPISKNSIDNLKSIFIIESHSFPRAKTIFYDLSHYRISKWRKIVGEKFEIIEEIKPCLYPYPNYPQFFKIRKSRIGTSSVFFICKKKILAND